jgi:hypothetical protein
VLAASEPIAGADTPLNIVLGIGVLLLFGGVLIRALAVRRRHLGRVGALRALVRAMTARPTAPDHTVDAVRAGSARSGAGSTPMGAARSAPASLEATTARSVHIPDRVADVGDEQPRLAFSEVAEPELERVPLASVERLGRTLDESRRLRAAEERVAADLAALPEGIWLVERDVHIGGRRVPFLAIGGSGIFVICATDGGWTLRDLHLLSELGDDVRRQLRGYDGPVHAAACLAFDEMKPRAWFGGQGEHGRGGWVLGLDWLRTWMLSFGPEHGLGAGDIRRLNAASGPFWERRSTARLPVARNVG